ncbi:signal recognition particle-docking protein FtsY [Candidatus Lokiarchaeum ossiferum]|uniref:signal recognition particle-docking protein FtsY n=1 Tax=Candidatus Lokiarchaeum ossiferum TaxID=2951803 RepID=UPI00352F2E13
MFKKLSHGLSSIFKVTLSEKNMDKTMEKLKLTLLKSDVAVQAAEEICTATEKQLTGEKIGAFSKKDTLQKAIQNSIYQILSVENQFDLINTIKNRPNKRKPYVIMVLGVNGTGKTTTIAKMVHLLKKENISMVVAAADTFRAGAIEQLGKHMKKLDTRLIKQEYSSDPASVAYDAIDHATAKKLDTVIIDTSGRQVTNKNLLTELQKIKRVNTPDLTLFIGDSLAGNDVLVQAEKFNESIGIDASIITKLDADSKGGAALSIAYITKKPIIYIGVGQKYEDLINFDPKWFISKLMGNTKN